MKRSELMDFKDSEKFYTTLLSHLAWIYYKNLKGLHHPACLARVLSWFAFVVAIVMAHENGDKQRLAKRPHVQGMLDETDPLNTKKCNLDIKAKQIGTIERVIETKNHHELCISSNFSIA